MTTTDFSTSSGRRSMALRLIVGFGPIANRAAGHRGFPLWGRLEHQGRRSGRLFSVPLAPRRTADGFVVALPFGPDVEWVRNTFASGTATMIWKGHRHPLRSPELIDLETASGAFPGLLKRIVRTAGIEHFIRFQDAPPTDG